MNAIGILVTSRTIKRRLSGFGLKGRIQMKKTILNHRQCKKRV
jgi:hypothetical protein